MMQFLLPVVFVLALVLPIWALAAKDNLPLMLAKNLTATVELSHYQVSEKYDGVRALWHHGVLQSRSGQLIQAPEWFLNGLPDETLEGELWIGYGRFNDISGLVRRKTVDNELWRQVSFMAFDLPTSDLVYQMRMQHLNELVSAQGSPWLKVVGHRVVSTQAELDKYLQTVLQRGGEGLMLNGADEPYQGKRSAALLKYKPAFDDEAKVIGYVDGKGKYAGKMGALVVELKNGRQFKIGTGFAVEDRENPPQIGHWVTFEYSGFTSTGLPRFARYIRLYEAH